jgi:outer membrane protein insertion porin family
MSCSMMQEVRPAGLRIIFVSLLWVCVATGVLIGAAADFEGKRVGSIAFDPSEQPLTRPELDQILPLKANEPLRLSLVRDSISRLFATGRYSDVVVDAELKDDQVAVRFLTKGAWFVNSVSVTGVPSPPGSGELVNSTGLTLGSPLHEDEVVRTSVEQLRRVLSANGFFLARIEPRFSFEDHQTEQENVQFMIEPGPRAHYTTPVITGDLKRPVARVVKDTGWKGWFGWKPVAETRTQRGLEGILQAYRKRNYLLARADLEKIDYNPATGRAIPTLRVAAGSPVVLSITGAKVSRSRLRRLVPVFEEQSVDLDLLVEGKNNLTDYLQTQGYFDAKVDFSSQTQPDGTLNIVYTVDRGERHRLKLLAIQGNRYFDTKTVRERMLVTPASTQIRRGRYSAGLLEHDVNAIRDLYRSN